MLKKRILEDMSGKREISTLFVVLTPFHYKSFLSEYKDALKNENVLILKEKYIDERFWKESNALILNLPDEKFSIYDLRGNFFNSIWKYRKSIKRIKQHNVELFDQVNFNDALCINIGSDRDVFTQVFLNDIYRRFNQKEITLAAFEEGIGFYDEKSFFEKIKAFIFPIASLLFFGEKLHFNKPQGIDRRINIVYCRFLELIKKNGFSEYKKLEVRENTNKGTYNPESNTALVFSFPSTSIDISEERKVELVSRLYEKLDIDEFVIKLHPREDKYRSELLKSDFNWTFLDGQHPLEELNYFDYKYIINFNSSIILDILSSEYPKKKIITLSLYEKLSIASLYDQTSCMTINDLLNEDKIRL